MTYAEHKYCNALQYWKSCNSFQFDAVWSSSAPWHLGSCELQYFRATLPQAAGVTGCFAKRQDSIGPLFSRENISVSSVLNSKKSLCFDCFETAKIALIFKFYTGLFAEEFLHRPVRRKAECPDPAKAEPCRAPRAKKRRGAFLFEYSKWRTAMDWNGSVQWTPSRRKWESCGRQKLRRKQCGPQPAHEKYWNWNTESMLQFVCCVLGSAMTSIPTKLIYTNCQKKS